jgi:ADP-ribose pyrophosphatase YjhB (NUDIX family)
MKKKFVGGILVDDNKILLVKRAWNDPFMGNLWSLPGGGIEVTENDRKALVREFKEETNLNITILKKLFVFNRASTEVTIFHVSTANVTLKSNDQDIEELCFFDLHKLPENIVIESLLYILSFQIAFDKINEHFSTIIDKVFASIFYSYLYPEFKRYNFNDETQIFKYIIESTPLRKFKSVIPFLLSKCDLEKIYLFLIPEICYSIWTLLDDCYDEKYFRYGVETGFNKYGKKLSVISLFNVMQNLNNLLYDKISIKNINMIESSLSLSATILYQRNVNKFDMNIEKYLAQSKARTKFLRISWRVVLEESGYNQKHIELIYNFQRQSSEIGQLINDYFDIVRGNLEDFDTKTSSMHWLLVHREADLLDKNMLESLWVNKESNKEMYQNLLKKYDIKNILQKNIVEKLDSIIKEIQDSDLGSDEKCILVAWHQMSFIHFKNDIIDVSILPNFINSVNNILYNY